MDEGFLSLLNLFPSDAHQWVHHYHTELLILLLTRVAKFRMTWTLIKLSHDSAFSMDFELIGEMEEYVEKIISIMCSHVVGEYITLGQWEAVFDEFLPHQVKKDICWVEVDPHCMEDVLRRHLDEGLRFTSESSINYIAGWITSVVGWILQIMQAYDKMDERVDRVALFRSITERAPMFRRINSVINRKNDVICGELDLQRLSSLPIFMR